MLQTSGPAENWIGAHFTVVCLKWYGGRAATMVDELSVRVLAQLTRAVSCLVISLSCSYSHLMDGGRSGLIWKEGRNFGDLTQLVWWASAGLVSNSQIW